MKALLDENLSPKLAMILADLFQEIKHARELGLKGAPDSQIWEVAKASAFDLLVTTDRDFLEILAENGPPPKVVRIERADVKTAQLATLLRKHAVAIRAMLEGPRQLLGFGHGDQTPSFPWRLVPREVFAKSAQCSKIRIQHHLPHQDPTV